MDKDAALNELNALVIRLQDIYLNETERWMEYAHERELNSFNFKTTKVCQIDSDILSNIRAYREFLNTRSITTMILDGCREGFHIEGRVKAANSVNEKIDAYMKKKEHGEMQVNKCLNDLFGARAIVDSELTHKDISEYFSDKRSIRCIDSSKPKSGSEADRKYVATHIYFKYRNNFVYQWELQIWKKSDEARNQSSHRTHRYEYTRWESEAKDDNAFHNIEQLLQ